MRQRLYRTEAVVLRRLELGETDRILTLLTPSLGKLRVIAKGVRRPTSRRAGHLEPLTHCTLLVARGSNLDVVTQAQTVNAFLPLREDLTRIAYASYLAELVDRLTPEHAEAYQTFDLLTRTLRRLSDGADPALTARFFEMALLSQMGFRPQLTRCASCQVPLEPADCWLAAHLGGVLCPECGRKDPSARTLPLGIFKLLRAIQREEWTLVNHVRLGTERRRELERALADLVAAALEREPRSAAVLHRIEKLAEVGS